jgi:hypothetical protein
MMPKQMITRALILLAFGVTPASAQAQELPPTDNDLFAAYCLANFIEQLRDIDRVDAQFPNQSNSKQRPEYRNLQTRLHRFEDYLLAHGWATRRYALTPAMKQGQEDYEACKGELTDCVHECSSQFRVPEQIDESLNCKKHCFKASSSGGVGIACAAQARCDEDKLPF